MKSLNIMNSLVNASAQYNVLIVEDADPVRYRITHAVKDCFPASVIVSCRSSSQALLELQNGHFDIVFIDAEMTAMNGMDLAGKLKQLFPRINIIICAESYQYALQAFDIHASGYIIKPADEEMVLAELSDLRYPVSEKEKKDIGLRIKSFGNFEVFYNGRPVRFLYSKTKELFALLIDRNGEFVTNAEIANILWDGDKNRTSYIKQLRKELADFLDAAGYRDALISRRGGTQVVPYNLQCDYYNYLAGNGTGINAYTGEYMQQYGWAGATRSVLDANSIRILENSPK